MLRTKRHDLLRVYSIKYCCVEAEPDMGLGVWYLGERGEPVPLPVPYQPPVVRVPLHYHQCRLGELGGEGERHLPEEPRGRPEHVALDLESTLLYALPQSLCQGLLLVVTQLQHQHSPCPVPSVLTYQPSLLAIT